MKSIVCVALGGAFGSVCRYLVVQACAAHANSNKFPVGTLAVNALGCLIAGFVFKLLESKLTHVPDLRSFLLVGFLGGFTTFSAFSLETVLLARDGLTFRAGVYLVGSLVSGLILTVLGMKIADLV